MRNFTFGGLQIETRATNRLENNRDLYTDLYRAKDHYLPIGRELKNATAVASS